MQLTAVVAALAITGLLAAAPLPEPKASQLPRWRGFNLLEKFIFWGEHKPYEEDDFRMISEFGFNFVRLPLDYRGLIVDGDWEKFHEGALKQIDQAVAWGQKYQVHVCLNLHRAPGYTVAKPPEPRDLWTDPEAQRVAALHWGMFARRFKGIPSANLSFNLFNEPTDISAATYKAVAEIMLTAIRAEDPQRLVLCDGLSWGAQPVPELIPLGVGQMTRGYTPFQLTHYQASWVGDNQSWPRPTWPGYFGTNGALLSPNKTEGSHPLIIEGPLQKDASVRLTIGTLSSQATLAAFDGDEEIFRQQFIAGPEKGPWEKVTKDPEWNNFKAEGRVDVRFTLPRATKQIQLRTVEGDWLSLLEIGITAPQAEAEAVVGLQNRWAEKSDILPYSPKGPAGPTLGIKQGREWLDREAIQPWTDYIKAGGGVMVGEWGAYKKTPHDVVLRWAEDSLKNWQKAGWGWALWNFRGDFGILDSGRSDVEYEDFHGHQLDREFLKLLQNY